MKIYDLVYLINLILGTIFMLDITVPFWYSKCAQGPLWKRSACCVAGADRKNLNIKRIRSPMKLQTWFHCSTGTRSWGGLPLKRRVCRCLRPLFSLHHDYGKKKKNCIKPQWSSWTQCNLWTFICTLSMHQFIEISICALVFDFFFFFERTDRNFYKLVHGECTYEGS